MTSRTSPPPAPLDRRGLLFGFAAYGLWGVLPLYYGLLEPAGPVEIVAHRIVWSVVFCVAVFAVTRAWRDLREVLRSPRMTLLLGLAGGLIGLNWTIYVYGVLTDRVVDVSLGYFINPLVTVLLAVLVLRERLRPLQWASVAFGGVAVLVITLGYGEVPWIALALAVSFAVYGLIKNRAGRTVGALTGLTVETTALLPIALGYLVWLQSQGATAFGAHGAGHVATMVGTGAITAVPLLLFNASARRLPLSVVGLLQYLAPLFQFVIGVVVMREQMPTARWWGFGLVWLALAALTVDALRTTRRHRAVAARALQTQEG